MAWLSWRSSTLSEPDDGEQARAGDRLRYRFAVGAPNPELVTPRAPARRIVLDADDYRGGRLDWYAFDAATNNAQLGAPPLASGVTAATTSMLPTPLQFRGMPSPRWWEFEDGSVALGNVDVAPEDLPRLLLVEFALCFSNDYFVVPVQLRPGSVSQVSRLSVTNTFGEVIAVAPMAPGGTRGKAWRMFSIADDAGGQLPHFVFPPVLAPTVESTPIEEVYFARDEMPMRSGRSRSSSRDRPVSRGTRRRPRSCSQSHPRPNLKATGRSRRSTWRRRCRRIGTRMCRISCHADRAGSGAVRSSCSAPAAAPNRR